MCFVRSKRVPSEGFYLSNLSRITRNSIPEEVLWREEQYLVKETMSAARKGDIQAMFMLRHRLVSEVDITCLKSKVKLNKVDSVIIGLLHISYILYCMVGRIHTSSRRSSV